MTQTIVIISADGMETVFDPFTRVTFDRDNLLIQLQNQSFSAGWHWDRFVGMMQRAGDSTKTGRKNSCEVVLRLANQQEKRLTIYEFLNFELNTANNFLKVNGRQQAAVVNLDFVHWFRTYR